MNKDFLFATPGRLIDILLNQRNVVLSQIETIVLDEADKLLEMGFSHMVNQIIKIIKDSCTIDHVQTLLVSATLNKEIHSILDHQVSNPVLVKEDKLQGQDELKLTHYFIRLKEDDTRIRDSTVLALCLKHFKHKTIIFLNEKKFCKRLNVLFLFHGLRVAQVHGDMTQKERMRSVELFQRDQVDFLLATDILSRGFDIHQVNAVINYQFPTEDSRYTHRVGRTARAGNYGTAITLTNEDERKDLKKVIKKSGVQPKPFTLSQALVAKVGEGLDSVKEYVQIAVQLERKERELYQAVLDTNKA